MLQVRRRGLAGLQLFIAVKLNLLRAVGFFEPVELFVREPDIECRNGIIDMVRLGDTHDGRRHGTVVQQPGERDLSGLVTAHARKGEYAIDYGVVFRTGKILHDSRPLGI